MAATSAAVFCFFVFAVATSFTACTTIATKIFFFEFAFAFFTIHRFCLLGLLDYLLISIFKLYYKMKKSVNTNLSPPLVGEGWGGVGCRRIIMFVLR